ncbi:MAG: TrbC/VirB2 family protein [Spirochaetaceae bacterium]|nr:TrbC/VirB2 family protein [Spirochaetaceae bacterium]
MKKLLRSVKNRITTFYLLALAGPAFGQANDVQGRLSSLGDQILEMLTGDIAKVIISCAFAGSCIAYAVNKDNEQAKQKILAVVIATALLGLAQWIVDWILGAAKG